MWIRYSPNFAVVGTVATWTVSTMEYLDIRMTICFWLLRNMLCRRCYKSVNILPLHTILNSVQMLIRSNAKLNALHSWGGRNSWKIWNSVKIPFHGWTISNTWEIIFQTSSASQITTFVSRGQFAQTRTLSWIKNFSLQVQKQSSRLMESIIHTTLAPLFGICLMMRRSNLKVHIINRWKLCTIYRLQHTGT